MGNIFNGDFQDFIRCFNEKNVEYILVGGMAVVLNGYVRTTGDMDVWVEKSSQNYQKIVQAFYSFGMPTFDMTEDRFLSDEYDVWCFGREPVRIDLMTEVKGINFKAAYEKALIYAEDGVDFRFLHANDLILAKQASGRYRDLNDIEQLIKLNIEGNASEKTD